MITSFRDQYNFLSNYYIIPIEFNNKIFLSVEHAYHASKALYSPDWQTYCLTEESPSQVKLEAKKRKLYMSPEDKLRYMSQFVKYKFTAHSDMRDRLLSTGNLYIIEGNHWGDEFWGVDKQSGAGTNHLGQILMSVRSYLRGEDFIYKYDISDW